MRKQQVAIMFIGLDDTDSPQGMCTTYIGALLARSLIHAGMQVTDARLIRLNPNVTWKTRGNAAVALEAKGDPDLAFDIACGLVSSHAELSCDRTHPGVVVMEHRPGPEFYQKAVHGFCTIDEATAVLMEEEALFRGYKLGRGLIGATAAVSAELPDETSELLVYRRSAAFGTKRQVDPASFFLADLATRPDTWDTVDIPNRTVVCVPHTPDPVLFGIRGKSPFHVARARGFIRTEPVGMEMIYRTNQGTDAHLEPQPEDPLKEGHSYRISGTVSTRPVTLKGGHVTFGLRWSGSTVTCMAFEPTKQFRHVIRGLLPGDSIVVTGSFKKNSLNLEKIGVTGLVRNVVRESPFCSSCGSRMTSAGRDKGYKCRQCKARAFLPGEREFTRDIAPGWYEVPSSARRHLARPLVRGLPQEAGGMERSPGE